MNTDNYLFEYLIIPNLIEKVKLNQNPIQSLVDVEWMKTVLASKDVKIDWDTFFVDIYDENNNKTTLEKGRYIAYTFPKIKLPPEAKYGVIDIPTQKYYTFESSDPSRDTWVIGNQEKDSHNLVEFIDKDMSIEEFLESIKGGSKLSGNNNSGCLSLVVIIIVVVICAIFALI